MKTILAVVPTFNRKDLVELTSAYLKRIPFDPAGFSFLISDDCSTEYGLSFLRAAYSSLPNAVFMKTNANSGALKHIWALLRHFAESDHDKVLVLDSDLVVHESGIAWAKTFDHELVSSLYNSSRHGVHRSCDGYCTKTDIGWAGALVDKSVIRALLDLFGMHPFDDWALSNFARQNGLTIKVAVPSAIEHIGIVGSNNFGRELFDHSIDFPRDRFDRQTREYLLQKHGIDLDRPWGQPTS
jgi:hypothetical protein